MATDPGASSFQAMLDAPMSTRERQLVRRLRERDEAAFRELVAEHRDRIYNLTLRMLGNKAEAEDVAQEVFITVFKTIESFREEAKFSTWLYRVAVNHCKNRIKYLARRHDRDRDELDETNEGAATAATDPPLPRPDRALEGDLQLPNRTIYQKNPLSP